MPNDSQRKSEIDAAIAEVAAQERAGQFNTVHHEHLKNLLKGQEPKADVNKKEKLTNVKQDL